LVAREKGPGGCAPICLETVGVLGFGWEGENQQRRASEETVNGGGVWIKNGVWEEAVT